MHEHRELSALDIDLEEIDIVDLVAGQSRADQLAGEHWQRFALECGLNPKQVIDRVGALAKLAISEAGAAEFEVAAMPAGRHPIVDETRLAVERRARALLAQLQDSESFVFAEADAEVSA